MIYVSAYYHIPKRQLSHMGISRYVRLLPETLRMIRGQRLVFYYEEEFIGRLVKRLCEDIGIEVSLRCVPLETLPQRENATIIANAARDPRTTARTVLSKEKGVAHLRAMDVAGDRSEYEKNLSVWLSKIDLTMSVAREIQRREPVAWIDIGVSKLNFRRHNWNFATLPVSPMRLSHYGSNMRYLGERLPLNASVLLGYPESWNAVCKLFNETVAMRAADCYPHDEETLLSHVLRETPDLFECIGHPYRGRIGTVKYFWERLRGGNLRTM